MGRKQKIAGVREPETEDAYTPLFNDDNSFASSSQTKAKQQKKCDPLLVKIKDIKTKETTVRKMTVNEVWDLEKKFEGEKWRSHKYKLRCNYFYPNKTKQEMVDNPPPGVRSAQWTTSVEYYFENDMKKICHQNSLNRGKLKVPHAGGSKSNARKSRQMAEKLGRPVCGGEVVLSNIVREDGSRVNEEGKKLAIRVFLLNFLVSLIIGGDFKVSTSRSRMCCYFRCIFNDI